MDIPILYEDENILALNKPAGIVVHKDGYNNEEETIADWLLAKYPTLALVGEPMVASNGVAIAKPGIVHRLDKDTSGVLLVAKNQSTYLALKKQFQDHSIEKIYRLLVYGNFSADKREGTIDLPIGRSRKDSRKHLAGRGASSVLREAVTHYQVIENFNIGPRWNGAANIEPRPIPRASAGPNRPSLIERSASSSDPLGRGYTYAYVEARPKTGRTHQLRVHFKAISHPLVCDSLYATGQVCLPGLSRQALHCLSLSFSLPGGQHLTVEAPLPADFQEALASLGHPCSS